MDLSVERNRSGWRDLGSNKPYCPKKDWKESCLSVEETSLEFRWQWIMVLKSTLGVWGVWVERSILIFILFPFLLNYLKNSFTVLRSHHNLGALHFRSARLHAFVMLQKWSFTPGRGLGEKGQALDNLKGASRVVVHRLKNWTASSSAEHERSSESSCCEAS